MNLKEIKLKIIDLIAKDELEKALKLLKENMSMDHPAYVSLIMQMRRLNNLQNKTNNATIAFNEANLERNKISQSLIKMTKSLSENPPPPVDESPPDMVHPAPESANIAHPPKYEDPLLEDDYDAHVDDDFEDDFDDMPSSDVLKGYQNEIFYQGSLAKEEQTIVINQSYDMTFLRCIQAINHYGFTLKQQNQSMGYIEAASGISIWSFGEEIHIYIRELEGYNTHVHIICDSTVKNTVTSWGKNAKNIKKIIAVLTQM